MTQHEIAIITLLAIEAVTLYALWLTHQSGEWWRKAWLRDSAELLEWKRNAVRRVQLHDMTAYEVHELAQWKRYGILRDPKTGRYVKKDKR